MKFSVVDLEDGEEISLSDYVAVRIGDIFDDVAEAVSRMDLPEDVAAGVPLALFHAEAFLKRAWLRYIGGDGLPPAWLEDQGVVE